jgi:hypothetical protein
VKLSSFTAPAVLHAVACVGRGSLRLLFAVGLLAHHFGLDQQSAMPDSFASNALWPSAISLLHLVSCNETRPLLMQHDNATRRSVQLAEVL